MNQVILIGRLTRDPELKMGVNSGSAICRMSIAVNREFKKEGEPNADFFNIVSFGKTAENAANYLGKGRMIGVVGNLRNNHYEDKNGVKHYGETVIASRIQFLDHANDNNGQQQNKPQGQQQSYQQNPSTYQQQQTSQNDFNGFQAIDGDDDIPF